MAGKEVWGGRGNADVRDGEKKGGEAGNGMASWGGRTVCRFGCLIGFLRRLFRGRGCGLGRLGA